MKRILFMLTLCMGFVVTLSAQDSAKGAKMTFEKTEIDYGTIKQGAEPLRTFVFTNTGSEPLLITSAKGSCGCTVPTYPKGAIAPGEKAEIQVRYDTNRVGPFTKTITLTTNASDDPILLTIKGKVDAKDAAPAGLPAKESSMFNGGR